MADDHHKELQLLPSPPSDLPLKPIRPPPSDHRKMHHDLDLKLSISLAPPRAASAAAGEFHRGGVETMRWQAAEQRRLAAIEKAYAERVRELTRKEMELAQSEFARARHMWQRAREEVERAERLKERATRRIDDGSTCMEITCQSCRQRFRP